VARKQTTPVGMFPANSWGLHDMHGNVLEWCLDHWHRTYKGAPTDGSAWLDRDAMAVRSGKEGQETTDRLLRGGSWHFNPRLCRSAYRNRTQPDDASSDVGFRVVCLPQDASLNP
jgi:formylglycine-generating enzyme required for sulfatase activity